MFPKDLKTNHFFFFNFRSIEPPKIWEEQEKIKIWLQQQQQQQQKRSDE